MKLVAFLVMLLVAIASPTFAAGPIGGLPYTIAGDHEFTGDVIFSGSVTLSLGSSIALPSGGVINWDSGDVTLTQSSNALSLAGGQLLVPDGSAAAPSIAFSSDVDTGFKYRATNVDIVAGGTAGASVSASAFNVPSGSTLGFSSNTIETGSADAFFMRKGAASIQMGVTAASPVAQTFSGPDGTGTDKAGGSLTIAGGRSTGEGVGGSVIIATAPAGGSSGSSVNTATAHLTLSPSSSGIASLNKGKLIIPAGTSGAPSLAVSETDVGLYNGGTDTLSVAANNVNVVNFYGGSGAVGPGLYLPSDTGIIAFGATYDATIQRNAANSLTTGIFANLKPVQNIAGTGSITTCAGHIVNVTAAGTATLPAGTTVGQNCSIVSTTAAVVSVDVASASDTMILDGTALTAGYKATSDGSDEWTLYCTTSVANTWRCRTVLGVSVDGGA